MPFHHRNLINTIDELINTEVNYIANLGAVIRDYKSIFKDPKHSKSFPDSLRGQEATIFGNIERILAFHNDELMPNILNCDRDVTKICEIFCDFIKRDYFYIYVLYAINQARSESVCKKNLDFFSRRQEELGDRLGLNSYLLKPIQRLPHYKLLFNQMIDALLKNIEDDTLKPIIAICCKTEKSIKILLETVNNSIHINDIENCLDFNVMHQGKFRKVDTFDIHDKSTHQLYRGQLFLFEKSLVYTEQMNKTKVIYRGHYQKNKLGIEPDHTQKKLVLFSGKRGQQCIEVSADATIIFEWKRMIDDILKEYIRQEKEQIKKGARKVRPKSTVEPVIRSITRGSIISTSSFSSDNSRSSSDRSSRISSKWTHSLEYNYDKLNSSLRAWNKSVGLILIFGLNIQMDSFTQCIEFDHYVVALMRQPLIHFSHTQIPARTAVVAGAILHLIGQRFGTPIFENSLLYSLGIAIWCAYGLVPSLWSRGDSFDFVQIK